MSTSSLTVTLTPSNALWSLDGLIWNNSGQILSNLIVGQNVTVQFSNIALYQEPIPTIVQIPTTDPVTISFTYAPILSANQIGNLGDYATNSKKWYLSSDGDHSFGKEQDLRIIVRYMKNVPRNVFDILETTSKLQTTTTSLFADGVPLIMGTTGSWYFGSCWYKVVERKNETGQMESQRDFYELWTTGYGLFQTFTLPQFDKNPVLSSIIKSKQKDVLTYICSVLPKTYFNTGHIEYDDDTALYSMRLDQTSEKTLTAGVITEDINVFEEKDGQEFTSVRLNNLDDQGHALPLWTPALTQGIEYSQTITQTGNDTRTIKQSKRVVNNVTNVTTRKAQDVYKTNVVLTNKADSTRAANPSAPSNGVITTVETTENDVGQFDNTTNTLTELPVSGSVLNKSLTLFNNEVEQIDRAQPLDTSLSPSFTAGTVITKKGEITNGNLLDVTTTTKIEEAVTGATLSKSTTIYESSVSSVDKAQAANTSLNPSVSGGVIVEKRGERTEGDLLDVTTITKTELPVLSSSTTKRLTAFEYVTDIENSNQSTPAADPVDDGVTVTNKENAGGTFNQTISIVAPTAVTGASKASSSTLYDISSSVADRNSTAALSPIVAVPTGGVVTSVTSALTPEGKYNNETTIKTEQAVASSSQSVTKTLFETDTTTLDKNSPTSTPITPPAAATGLITTIEATKTAGNLLDVNTRTRQEQDVTSALVYNNFGAIETENQVLEKSAAKTTDLTSSVDGTTHVLTIKKGEKTAGDLLDVTTTIKTPIAIIESIGVPDKGGPLYVYNFRNQKLSDLQTLLNTTPFLISSENVIHCQINEYGLYDGTIHNKQLSTGGGIGFWYTKEGETEVRHREQTIQGIRWIFEDTITYSIAKGSGVQYGQDAYSGAGPGSLFKTGSEDSFYIKRITAIDRKAYKYGTTDAAGVWTPGDKVVVGSSENLFTADHTPWGNS